MPPVTGVVYQNENIEFVLREGSYSVQAKSDIPLGTLILLEHVAHGNIYGALMCDTSLFAELYPRESEPNCKISDKALMNLFWYEDDVIIGKQISKFNHSCHRPNSILVHGISVGDDKAYAVFTCTKVLRGQELTFDYMHGIAGAHDKMKEKHGFTCECTVDDMVDTCIWSRTSRDVVLRFRDEMIDDKTIPNLFEVYLSQNEGKCVSAEQVRARAVAIPVRK